MRIRTPGAAQIAGFAYVLLAAAAVARGGATPQFARQTRLACSSCHSHVPLLNEFGQKFFANGFKLPKNHKMYETVPAWVGLSAKGSSSPPSNAIPVAYDDSELASYGFLNGPGLLYHFEWHPIAHDVDVYGIHPFGRQFALTAGKIGILSQYDPGLDITQSTPVYLAPLPTSPNNTAAGPFSPSGTAFAVRGTEAIGNAMPYGDGLHLAETVLFSNDQGNSPLFQTGSNPKGLFLETFSRHGMTSYGVNYYVGRDGRHYYGAVSQVKLGEFLFEGGGGYAQGFGGQTHAYSIGSDWTPMGNLGLAFRIDDQDGLISYVPTISSSIGYQLTSLRLVLEAAISHGAFPMTTLTAVYRF